MFMTAYVATRWYRAPEVMLSFKEYTQAIDVWSVGCIFAEMMGRKYLFAGANYVNQLNLILNLLGTPREGLIAKIGSSKAQAYLRSLKPKGPIPLAKLYPHASTDAIALLERMLLFDPAQRCTMTEALESPFLAQYHNKELEPVCTPFDFEFEKKKFTAAELKRSILQEIDEYHSSNQPPLVGQLPTAAGQPRYKQGKQQARRPNNAATGNPSVGSPVVQKRSAAGAGPANTANPVASRKRVKVEGAQKMVKFQDPTVQQTNGLFGSDVMMGASQAPIIPDHAAALSNVQQAQTHAALAATTIPLIPQPQQQLLPQQPVVPYQPIGASASMSTMGPGWALPSANTTIGASTSEPIPTLPSSSLDSASMIQNLADELKGRLPSLARGIYRGCTPVRMVSTWVGQRTLRA